MTFFRYDGTQINLRGFYQNQHCFWIGGGPSFSDENYDLALFLERGILTCGVNNVAANRIDPNIWIGADDPRSYHANILNDPNIIKFLPQNHCSGYFFSERSEGKVNIPVSKSPSLLFYNRISGFDPKTFLAEKEICWGNDKGKVDSLGLKGCRSVMMASLKILYILGFRYVYLLGCDFKMEYGGKGKTYSFPQMKHHGGVRTNNLAYQILNERFKALFPIFQQMNFHVFNCTPDSKLTAFPTLNFERAYQQARNQLPSIVNTEGYYGGLENGNRFGFQG